MPYRMHRVFCASPHAMQDELNAFHAAIGEVNEFHAMARGVLWVPACLTVQMTDKRVFQRSVDENIRSSRYYIQVLDDSWGPPERHFAADYRLACDCAADPALPMQEAIVLWPKSGSRLPEIASLPALEYANLEEYQGLIRASLIAWLGSIEPAEAAHGD